jgi:cyclopropane-fatty-acyl-phospholipid synthase
MSSSNGSSRHVSTTVAVLERLTRAYGPLDFAIRLWDGTIMPAAPGQPTRFTMVLTRPDALYRMMVPPSKRAAAEAYVNGDLEIEGDFIAGVDVVRSLSRKLSLSDVAAVVPSILKLKQPRNGDRDLAKPVLPGGRHTKERDKAAIRFHYDIGTDFYALWLDQRMVYSCSYFPTGQETLDESQERKLDHICRKLRLQPGETFLDLGCGYGGLVMHAAERYGVQARGITISKAHGELAQKRIQEKGLGDRCRVDIMDYRELPRHTQYDKIAAIGIIEHVGENRLNDYFSLVWDLLKPGSVFLNHGICWPGSNRSYQRKVDRLPFARNFIQRHIFPDLDLLPLHTILRSAGRYGWEVRDVENLREHYTITLRKWLENLDANWHAAVAEVGEPTARIFRAYLGYSSYSFQVGDINLIHTLFAKPTAHGVVDVPMTRRYMYP